MGHKKNDEKPDSWVSRWMSRMLGRRTQAYSLSRETVLRLLNEEIWQPMRREGWRVRNRKARLKVGEAVLAADFHLIQKDDQRGPTLPINAVMVDTGIYFEYIPNFWNIAPPEQTAAIACPIRHTVKRNKKTKGGEYLNYWFEPDEASMRELLREIKHDIDERMVPLLRQLAEPAALGEFARTHCDNMDGLDNLWGGGNPGSRMQRTLLAYSLLRQEQRAMAATIFQSLIDEDVSDKRLKSAALTLALQRGYERAQCTTHSEND